MKMVESSPAIASDVALASGGFMYDDISLGSMQPSDEMGGGSGLAATKERASSPFGELDGLFDEFDDNKHEDQYKEPEQQPRGADDDDVELRDDAATDLDNPVVSGIDDFDVDGHDDGNGAMSLAGTQASALVDYFMKVVPDKLMSLRQQTAIMTTAMAPTVDADYEQIPTSERGSSSTHNKSINMIENSTHSRTNEAATERSSHSRCVIENTEKIEERRTGNDDCDGATRDQGYSVEEYTQISELTMDIPTIAPEPKFAACSALPTISEAKKFNPNMVGCAPGLAVVSRKPLQSNKSPSNEPYNSNATINLKAHCGIGGGNSIGNCQKGGRGDVIDFVFELMEDAICKPVSVNNPKTKDKHEAFAAALKSDSIQMTGNNSLVDIVQHSASKHSRSQRTTKRSNYNAPTTTSTPVRRPTTGTTRTPRTQDSTPSKATDDKRKTVVDKIPLTSTSSKNQASKQRDAHHNAQVSSSDDNLLGRVPLPPKQAATFSEEQPSLDWSKIMSFAEKQLEADETKSVNSHAESKFSRISRMTRQSRKSFFTAIGMEDDDGKNSPAPDDSQIKIGPESTASSRSSSASTHATAAKDAINSDRTANVSLMDVSNLADGEDDDDEESITEGSRLLLTSLLLNLLRKSILLINEPTHDQNEAPCRNQILVERQQTREARIAQFGEESYVFRFLRYVVFFLCFYLWPSGIPRRKVQYPHIPTKAEQPSLLKLVKSDKRPPPSSFAPHISPTAAELAAAALEESF